VLKQAHNFLISTILFCFLTIPCVNAQTTIPVAREIMDNNKMELIQNEVKIQDNEIEPINTQKVKETIVPDPQKEGKKIIGLFIKTMTIVVLCSVMLYLVLLFVRKFFSSDFIENNDLEDIETLDLSTPVNKQDALRSFLSRTK